MKIKEKSTDRIIHNFLDKKTGELLESVVEVKKEHVLVKSKEEFFMAYSGILSQLKDLSPATTKFLIWVCLNSTVNNSKISVVKHTIEEAKNYLNLSESSIRKSVSELKKANILISLGSGLYRVNPKYYWREDRATRDKTLKYVLTVECPHY